MDIVTWFIHESVLAAEYILEASLEKMLMLMLDLVVQVIEFVFNNREEDDPSECAVPISTTLIKQIASKSDPGGSVSQVLSEFYGIASPPQPAWPYNRKDSDR